MVGGWAYPLWKNMKISWDDEIPNWMEKQKMFQNHQSENDEVFYLLWN